MLTEAWLKQNLGGRNNAVREVADGDGLSVRISAKGKIVFQMRYRCAGKPKRLDLGVFPAMSLPDARAKHSKLRQELQRGIDPKVVHLDERPHVLTLDSAIDALGEVPVETTPRPEVLKILDEVERSSLARSSKRFLRHCLSVVVSLETCRYDETSRIVLRRRKT